MWARSALDVFSFGSQFEGSFGPTSQTVLACATAPRRNDPKLPVLKLTLDGSLSASRPFAVSPMLSAYSGFKPLGHRAALVTDISPEPEVMSRRKDNAAL